MDDVIARLLIVYSRKRTPKNQLNEVRAVLDKYHAKFSKTIIQWENIDTWNQEEISRLINDIRKVSARFMFRVRSKGVGPLALSNSGQLNVTNTAVACFYDKNGNLMFVLPSAKGPKHARFDLTKTLTAMIDGTLSFDDLMTGASVEEKDIITLLRWYPHLLEPNLLFKDWEVLIDDGRIDLVFIDEEKNHLLVEVEITVTDQALGQVLRFREPYARKMAVPIEKVRLALVGIDVDKNVISGIKGLAELPISLYQFKLEAIVDNYHQKKEKE